MVELKHIMSGKELRAYIGLLGSRKSEYGHNRDKPQERAAAQGTLWLWKEKGEE